MLPKWLETMHIDRPGRTAWGCNRSPPGANKASPSLPPLRSLATGATGRWVPAAMDHRGRGGGEGGRSSTSRIKMEGRTGGGGSRVCGLFIYPGHKNTLLWKERRACLLKCAEGREDSFPILSESRKGGGAGHRPRAAPHPPLATITDDAAAASSSSHVGEGGIFPWPSSTPSLIRCRRPRAWIPDSFMAGRSGQEIKGGCYGIKKGRRRVCECKTTSEVGDT